jgi:uncharacterized protein YgbK (DUF1537 family)
VTRVPSPRTFIILDDDPTGAQNEADVPLLLRWPADAIGREVARAPRALHLITNSRALSVQQAYDIVRDAAAAAVVAAPGSPVILRGDSTLRAHLLPEYQAVRDVCWPGIEPALLLVPALPSAGRVTVGGVHWLERDGSRCRLDETEFASDGDFAYDTARLSEWAEQRSGGHFGRADAHEILLEEVRGPGGAERIAAALRAAGTGHRPGVVVPDAETEADLAVIADGWRAACAGGAAVIVRCAPAFVGVLAGSTAKEYVPLPSGRSVLVLVGSHVPLTGRQLAELTGRHPSSAIEVDPVELARPEPNETVRDAAARARDLLVGGGLAVISTSRVFADEVGGPDAGMRVARGLAATLGALRDLDGVVVVSKGGITSTVNVHHGLGADSARVVGPVAPGVSLWSVPDGAAARPVIIFPGNVGAPGTLADLVDGLLGS